MHEPDRSIIQPLIMERLLLGGVQVAPIQGKGAAPRPLYGGAAIRLGERRAPSYHRELGLLAHVSGWALACGHGFIGLGDIPQAPLTSHPHGCCAQTL
jgi:hypothetical protein